jgi:hypothetical protein
MKRLQVILLFAICGLVHAGEVPPRPIALRGLPLLFADDSGVAVSTGVVRTVYPARTRSAPVLVADQPWEGARVYIYGSVYFDEATHLLRLWYMTRVHAFKGDFLLQATSQDGLSWSKPSLGLHNFEGSTSNNILFSVHSPSMLRDDREPDPSKRYKLLGSKGGGYHAAFSADGMRWTSYPKNPVLKYGDTITLTQDPATGEYLAFHKRPAKVREFPRRVVWLARSRDFQTWTEPELVFAPDAEDDAWATGPAQRTEVYNMSVFPHAAGFIGMPTIFHLTVARRPKAELTPGQSPDDGPIDVQLATSTDGRQWQRTVPRVNVIPRGAPGTFDGGAILGVSSTTVDVGEETWVYYTALTTTHGGALPAKQLTIGRAAWRRHGFVSLDAGAGGGRIETKPLQLGGTKLLINADAGHGKLRVALLEADGRAIPGLGLDDCTALTADATGWPARWQNAASVPTNRPVRVVVELTNAKLFSLAARP